MSRRAVVLLITLTTIAAGGVAYAAGFAAGRAAPAALAPRIPIAQPVQSQDPFQPPFLSPEPFQGPQAPPPAPAPQPFQAPPGQPPTMREFIPIPGPGDQMPGMRPDQGECEPIILFYHNGQLYQLRPGPGPQDGQGRPGTPPEFFYLNPYQGPTIPGLPMPRPDRGPGFTPINPRS